MRLSSFKMVAFVLLMHRFWHRLLVTLEMIKFEHSIFALPFALTGALLAWRERPYGAGELGYRLLWIVVAMVSARSAAMTFNRLLDAKIDARNRRTANRALPAQLVTQQFAVVFTIAMVAIFVTAAAALGPLCLVLSPVALSVLFFYSYTKRFTDWSHLFLGLALGIAPAAAALAIRPVFDPRTLLLTAAVLCWTAGFDIIYACQDVEFDRAEGLHSIPRRFGIATALQISRLFHFLMIASLVALVPLYRLGPLSWVGIAVVACLLVYEQGLVKPGDLSRVNAAFFTVNGYVSLLFLAFWATDIVVLRRLS